MGKTNKAAPRKQRKSDSLAKKNAKLDAYYERIEVRGSETLRALRKVEPDATPFETTRLLEEAFIESYCVAEDNDQRVDAIEELVATSLMIHALDESEVQVVRDCVSLIEENRKALRVKKTLGTVGRITLGLAELAVFLIPGGGAAGTAAKGAKAAGVAAKATRAAKAAKAAKIAAVAAAGITKAGQMAKDSGADKKATTAARKVLAELKKRIGPVPKAWAKG
jgi:hypothetical protein